MDWSKIKAEYIAGGTSYRKLAEKYEVSLTTLTRHAKREQWQQLREQCENDTTTKIIKQITDNGAKKSVSIDTVADKLLTRIEQALDKTEEYDGKTIRAYTSALKDLKEIKGIKSKADIREQEARIRNLEKMADKNDDESSKKDVTVHFVGDAEEYSK